MILFLGFLMICVYIVFTLTIEHFVSQFIVSLVIVLFLHELGHILAIIFYNWTENRKLLNFKIKISWHSFEVHNLVFENKLKNIVIACAGAIFPFFFCVTYFLLTNGSLAGMLVFASLLNFALLLPVFPDGKNVLDNMKKGV